MQPLIASDKYFWHRYIDTYLAAFPRLGEVKRLVEFGVFRGDSIRWLAETFTSAEIFGLDILPPQPSWPVSDRIRYIQLDQSDRYAVRTKLQEIGAGVDLIIEDGSHIPQHQATCLAEGIHQLRPGGLYILEDIGTSHPLNEPFAHHSLVKKKFSLAKPRRLANALNVIMALQHIKDIKGRLTPQQVSALAGPQFFSEKDIENLALTVDRVEIYKRTQLPLECYACHGSDFNYVDWLCKCGTRLNDPADSMTALIWKK